MMRLPIRKITLLALMASIGMIVSYLESFIVIPVAIPGIKLGLSNIVTVLVLYLCGPLSALTVLIVRVVLSAFMFTSLSSMLYSLSGALCSLLVMSLIYKSGRISCIGVSIVGGVIHNMAQLGVAVFVLQSKMVLYYTPALIIAGDIAGLFVGFISSQLLVRLKGVFYKLFGEI